MLKLKHNVHVFRLFVCDKRLELKQNDYVV